MSHYAVVAPPLFSHVRALQALAQALMARGHRITFIQPPEARSLLSDANIAFEPVENLPAGTPTRAFRLTVNPRSLSLFGVIDDMAHATDRLCCALPAILNRLAVDGLIVDQMEPAGGLVADALGLPFVSVACALPVNREAGLPLPVMPFAWGTDRRAQKLYHSSQQVYDWMMRGHTRIINRHARAFGLTPRQGLHDCLSPLAQISQTLPALDFPRRALPAGFHAVGPLRSPGKTGRAAWPLDPSRPFIFASLGTLQGHRFRLFNTIARACRRLDAQLLIAHCGSLNSREVEKLRHAGASWVTDFADQDAVLRQAQAVVTHGGLNTVADAVKNITPILAIPIAFDQPGVAARVAWSGTGRRASRFSSSKTLAHHLDALLNDNRYRENLSAMQAQLSSAGGASAAALIVEQALSPRFSTADKVAP